MSWRRRRRREEEEQEYEAPDRARTVTCFSVGNTASDLVNVHTGENGAASGP